MSHKSQALGNNMAKYTAWLLELVFDPNQSIHCNISILARFIALHSCVQTKTYRNRKRQSAKMNLPSLVSGALVCVCHYVAKSKRMERWKTQYHDMKTLNEVFLCEHFSRKYHPRASTISSTISSENSSPVPVSRVTPWLSLAPLWDWKDVAVVGETWVKTSVNVIGDVRGTYIVC